MTCKSAVMLLLKIMILKRVDCSLQIENDCFTDIDKRDLPVTKTVSLLFIAPTCKNFMNNNGLHTGYLKA